MNFKQIHIWSCDCHRVSNLLLCVKFHQNRVIFVEINGDLTIFVYGGGRGLPSLIFEISILYHANTIQIQFIKRGLQNCQGH